MLMFLPPSLFVHLPLLVRLVDQSGISFRAYPRLGLLHLRRSALDEACADDAIIPPDTTHARRQRPPSCRPVGVTIISTAIVVIATNLGAAEEQADVIRRRVQRPRHLALDVQHPNLAARDAVRRKRYRQRLARRRRHVHHVGTCQWWWWWWGCC